MKRPKYQVIKEHKASFTYAMLTVEGDEISVGREDPEMPGWYWCKDKKGVEAWIPTTHISIKGTQGRVTQDYNSNELNAEAGEIVQYLGESLGWIECLNKDWRYGWMPVDKLELIL
jgi:hypothetical protein